MKAKFEYLTEWEKCSISNTRPVKFGHSGFSAYSGQIEENNFPF